MAEQITSDQFVKRDPGSDQSVLSIASTLRKSIKVSGANILGVLVLFPVNILLARVLGPELWGAVGYVALWQLYASFSRPGMFSAAYREIPPLLAKGESAEARRIQNIGVTGDGLYVILPIMVMVVAALFQKEVVLRNGLIIGALIFALTQARDMLTNLQWAHQRFGLVAKINVLVTLVTAVFMLGTVKLFGYLTPILSPGVAAITVMLALRFGAPPLGLRFQLDRTEIARLLKIGIPLGLSTLFYWGFRMADRTAAALWLSLTELGYFTFVLQFINLAILLVSDFCNVVQPALWAELGRTKSIQSLGPQIRRLCLVVVLVTSAGTNIAQAGFGALVFWLVPKFIPSVKVFEIVAFLLTVGTLGFVPTHVLNSAKVNKQSRVMLLWGLSLPFNIALAYLMVKLGWGLIGIAVGSVIAQGLASFVLLLITQRLISHAGERHLIFYGGILATLSVAVGFFVACQFGPLVYASRDRVLATLLLRLVLFVLVWGSIGALIFFGRKGAGFRLSDKPSPVFSGSAVE